VAVPPQPPRPRGRHCLRSRALAVELVREAGVKAGELVLDLGAGDGMLTGPLVASGARVVAVELDSASIAALRRRFRTDAEIVEADALTVTLPREPFAVVANLPFAVGTPILRRLLDDPLVPLRQADVIVEWGLAAKRAAVWPTTLTSVYWSAWNRLELVRRLPRACFAPPPAVDAALLRIVRRNEPLVPNEDAHDYHAFLHRSFRDAPVVRLVPEARGLATELGFDRHARARDLDARQWAALFRSARSRRGGSVRRGRPSSSR
jgi:23S rRNA (adenine-N6)-dimethyltransferase